MAKRIEHAAADRRMTLDEVAAFVADAFGSGATGAEEVAATVTLGGKLRTVVANVQPKAEANDEGMTA